MSCCDLLPPLVDEASLILLTSKNDITAAARTLSARMGVPVSLSAPILEEAPRVLTEDSAEEIAIRLMRAHETFLATAPGDALVRAIVEEVLLLTEDPDLEVWASRFGTALHAHLGVDLGTGTSALTEHHGNPPPYDEIVEAAAKEVMANLENEF